MNKKFLFIVFIFSLTIFSHYYNKHNILNICRENDKLSELLKSRKEVNSIMLMENIELSARFRIEKLAIEELGMCYPENTDSRHTIVMNKKESSFCLVDYIIPSAEAFTKN